MRFFFALLIAACGSCSGRPGDAASGPPASAAEAAKVLDLGTFPLVKGADAPNQRNVAGLSYVAPGTVKAAFEFQRKQLADRGWNELPGTFVSEQSSSGSFSQSGFTLSVMVFPGAKDGTANVSISNHGNVALGKLPLPADTKPLFAGPVSASYVTEASVDKTADTCRKLLMEQGWRPYGTAGDVQFFKQNCIRLAARVMSAPAQGGKTVIDYSSTLMSAELPAPADAEGVQYSDTPTQLFFDTPASQQDMADYYRKTLAESKWAATTENLIKIDFKNIVIFRNPGQDMLTLELTEVEGKTRVLLKFLSGAQVAEIERRIEEEQEKDKQKAK